MPSSGPQIAAESQPLLQVANLCKQYQRNRWLGQSPTVQALNGVTLTIPRQTTLALVGASGSGKTTLARCLVRAERPSSGAICYDGADVLGLHGEALRLYRRKVQLIVQDASTALNPFFTAEEIVAEPLEVQRWGTVRARRQRAQELMEQVGLSPTWRHRRACQLSGGQRQRLAIARALSLNPELLVLDEPFAGLDVSSQAQIIALLSGLQVQHGLTYLLIAHDLTVASQMAREIAVMDEGSIVERAATSRLLATPQHPRAQALLAADLGAAAARGANG
jgi:peptide/nickel transport system ATP-binding protein